LEPYGEPSIEGKNGKKARPFEQSELSAVPDSAPVLGVLYGSKIKCNKQDHEQQQQ
jgi:hypothetical protein